MRNRYPRRGNDALQDILRAAMPILVEQWDGELDRVAFIAEGEPVRFIARAEAVQHVVRTGASFVGDGAREAREKLEGAPAPDRIDCIVEGWGSGGVMRIDLRDFAQYLSGDFESPVPGGSAKMMAASADAEVAAALIEQAAERLAPTAPPQVDAAVEALLETPDDHATILARVREAIVACRPAYGTAEGQTMGLVLNSIARATMARAEGIVPNARLGPTLRSS